MVSKMIKMMMLHAPSLGHIKAIKDPVKMIYSLPQN